MMCVQDPNVFAGVEADTPLLAIPTSWSLGFRLQSELGAAEDWPISRYCFHVLPIVARAALDIRTILT